MNSANVRPHHVALSASAVLGTGCSPTSPMRTASIAAFALVVALTCGCTKRQGTTTLVGGAVVALSGLAAFRYAEQGGGANNTAMDRAYLGIGIAVVGGVIILGSIVGLAVGPDESRQHAVERTRAASRAALRAASWSRRFGGLQTALERDTSATVVFRADQVILQTEGDSKTCVGLAWTTVLQTANHELLVRGIKQASCIAGDFVVWSGPLDGLPVDVGATNCGATLAALAAESDPVRNAHLWSELPIACHAAARGHPMKAHAP